MARLLEVPTNALVCCILSDWLNSHYLESQQDQNKLLSKVRESQKNNAVRDIEGDSKVVSSEGRSRQTMINLSIRNVTLDTRVRLSIIAAKRGKPIYKTVEELVSAEWDRIKDKPGFLNIRLRKQINRIITFGRR